MKLLILVLFLSLTGCSSIKYQTNTKGYIAKKVHHNIRKDTVKSYTHQQVWALKAAQVGHVEANYCQVDPTERQPSNQSLISALALKTQKLGGNALVFDACQVNTGTARCHSYTSCRGMAYLVTH